MTTYDSCPASETAKHCTCWYNLNTCCACEPIQSRDGEPCDCGCIPHERDRLAYAWMCADNSLAVAPEARLSMGVKPALPDVGQVCRTLGNRSFVWSGKEWEVRSAFNFGQAPLHEHPLHGDVWWCNDTGIIYYFDGVKWWDGLAQSGAQCCVLAGTKYHSAGCPQDQSSSGPRFALPEADARVASYTWREILRLDPNMDPFVAHDPQPPVAEVIAALLRCRRSSGGEPVVEQWGGSIEFELKDCSPDLLKLLFGADFQPSVEVPAVLLESILGAIKTLSDARATLEAILLHAPGGA